jgi:hypothetical protein
LQDLHYSARTLLHSPAFTGSDQRGLSTTLPRAKRAEQMSRRPPRPDHHHPCAR